MVSGYIQITSAFSGRVIDSVTAQPVADALIYLENSGIVDTTDDEGRFSYTARGYTAGYKNIQSPGAKAHRFNDQFPG